ncbi:hypothetical protein X737_27945 [Mesorhizobium sp. L48C026A00]|nr:hypothetical protein X737_27945 [Mesorhizobium sp. L48C026A00]
MTAVNRGRPGAATARQASNNGPENTSCSAAMVRVASCTAIMTAPAEHGE